MKASLLFVTLSFLQTVLPSPVPGQGCATKVPTEFVPHVNAPGGYTLDLPKGWEVVPFEDDVDARNPRTDGCLSASASVTTERLERESGADAYLNERLPLIRSLSSNWTESERTDAVLGALPAKKFQYSHTKGNAKWTFIVYVAVKGTHAYLVQCGAHADLFDQYRSTCERILQSFKFK